MSEHMAVTPVTSTARHTMWKAAGWCPVCVPASALLKPLTEPEGTTRDSSKLQWYACEFDQVKRLNSRALSSSSLFNLGVTASEGAWPPFKPACKATDCFHLSIAQSWFTDLRKFTKAQSAQPLTSLLMPGFCKCYTITFSITHVIARSGCYNERHVWGSW